MNNKDLQQGQNSNSLPAPSRFTRKNKLNDGQSSKMQSTRKESHRASSPNEPSIPLDDPYDNLLHKLMTNWELPSDASTNLDTQLNEPS